MENPFSTLAARLENIEDLLITIKHETLPGLFSQRNEFQDLPELLTRKQAAEMLSVSIGTLDAWTKEGLLTKYRNNQIVRYRKSEILESFKSLTGRKYSRIEKNGGAK